MFSSSHALLLRQSLFEEAYVQLIASYKEDYSEKQAGRPRRLRFSNKKYVRFYNTVVEWTEDSN